jgi:hypothetical protein
MNRKYLFLLIFLLPLPVSAADGLGRLFLTPDQRAQLDVTRTRRDQRQPAAAEPAPAVAAPVPQGPETVTYSGLVRRSDGKSTVWINGKPVDERSRTRGAGDINVLGMRADGAVSVAIPLASRTASLRVGQSLDVNSGRIAESYARRSMQPHPAETNPISSIDSAPQAISPQSGTPTPAASPPARGSQRPLRPLPESYFRESDPESGAAPRAERDAKK